MRNVPIGLQNIQEIITDGYIYVDKTQFALNLILSYLSTSVVLPTKLLRS